MNYYDRADGDYYIITFSNGDSYLMQKINNDLYKEWTKVISILKWSGYKGFEGFMCPVGSWDPHVESEVPASMLKLNNSIKDIV
jgi:hypothetical protein